MSQCVPNWDLDDTSRLQSLRSRSNSTAPDVPLLDYEVAELTWEKGQLAMHGLGPPRVPTKHSSILSSAATTTATAAAATKYSAWEKPRAGGTLESIVNQATRSSLLPPPRNINKNPLLFVDAASAAASGGGRQELAPWFDHKAPATGGAAAPAAASAIAATAVSMDAQVPSSANRSTTHNNNCSNDRTSCVVRDSVAVPGGGLGTCGAVNIHGSYSTQVTSCSAASGTGVGANLQREDENALFPGKRARVARVTTSTPEWSGRPDLSVSGTSATFGSQQMMLDSCERDLGFGFTSTNSLGSPENASSGKPSTKATATTATTAAAADDHDHHSVCHSRPQRDSGDEEDKKKRTGKSSVSTKRSRAAAIHNQSERKRRDKINQRMKTLQKLVPNSSKTDKASMLDEVIDYLKHLQAQVQMMSRMNITTMMLPMAMQQQLQMSMMSPLGMTMDMNTIGRTSLPAISPLIHPNPFMPITSWDHGSAAADGRLQPHMAAVIPDPLSSFFACQSQPMTTEAYSRMAAMYQHLHQPPSSSSKS